jgi:hypothetical protein
LDNTDGMLQAMALDNGTATACRTTLFINTRERQRSD